MFVESSLFGCHPLFFLPRKFSCHYVRVLVLSLSTHWQPTSLNSRRLLHTLLDSVGLRSDQAKKVLTSVLPVASRPFGVTLRGPRVRKPRSSVRSRWEIFLTFNLNPFSGTKTSSGPGGRFFLARAVSCVSLKKIQE